MSNYKEAFRLYMLGLGDIKKSLDDQIATTPWYRFMHLRDLRLCSGLLGEIAQSGQSVWVALSAQEYLNSFGGIGETEKDQND